MSSLNWWVGFIIHKTICNVFLYSIQQCQKSTHLSHLLQFTLLWDAGFLCQSHVISMDIQFRQWKCFLKMAQRLHMETSQCQLTSLLYLRMILVFSTALQRMLKEQQNIWWSWNKQVYKKRLHDHSTSLYNRAVRERMKLLTLPWISYDKLLATKFWNFLPNLCQ